jgi:hypothetical protein
VNHRREDALIVKGLVELGHSEERALNGDWQMTNDEWRMAKDEW